VGCINTVAVIFYFFFNFAADFFFLNFAADFFFNSGQNKHEIATVENEIIQKFPKK